MLIKETLSKWLCLGYDKQTIQKHLADIDDSNLKILTNICFGGFFTYVFCALIFVFFEKSTERIVSFTLTALCSLIIYIISKMMTNKNIHNSSGNINALITFFIFWCCFQATYVGTFKSNNNLAVTAICTFALGQIIFDRLPLQNLMVVVPCGIIFIFCSFITKDSPIISTYDAIHAFISITIGFFISWNKSRLKLDNIITNLKLTEANYALYHTSTTDSLTGLSNRRKTFNRIADLQKLCAESDGLEMCVIVMDIDNFKAYNDFYGHPLGDKLLEKVGNALNQYALDNKLDVGRIGGEEFMAFWQNKLDKSEETIAEELRLTVANLNIPNEKSVTAPMVTTSVGIFSAGQQGCFDVGTAYALADQALYKAKGHGKNCCWRYCIYTKNFVPINVSEPLI